MQVIYYHVDAFTRHVFGGNPAGVCRGLADSTPDDVLQKIAAENNLPETAFIFGKEGVYRLRWFTPAMEVDLCGHATLAAAHVLWRHETDIKPSIEDAITFQTKSGPLTVTRNDQELMTLNFPSRPAIKAEMPADAEQAFSARPLTFGKARDYLFEFADEATVRGLQPDFARLAAWDTFGIIVTAPGDEVDFVSRFFAPGAGIPEDPVTGSAHCTLIPFWAEKLGKKVLQARQISGRNGELFCEATDTGVKIGGYAVTYGRGVLEFDLG